MIVAAPKGDPVQWIIAGEDGVRIVYSRSLTTKTDPQLQASMAYEHGAHALERQDAAVIAETLNAAAAVTLISGGQGSGTPLHLSAYPKALWSIEDESVLTDRQRITALGDTFKDSVSHNDIGTSGCFDPHRALLFRSGGEEITLLVCFECGAAETSGFLEPRLNRHFQLAMDSSAMFQQWESIFAQAGLKPALH